MLKKIKGKIQIAKYDFNRWKRNLTMQQILYYETIVILLAAIVVMYIIDKVF